MKKIPLQEEADLLLFVAPPALKEADSGTTPMWIRDSLRTDQHAFSSAMKVAILTRDYPPAIGGIATHVEGLVKALRRMCVQTDLYVGSHDVRTLLLPFDIPLKEYDVVHVQSLPYGAFVFGVPLIVTVHSPVLEEFAHYRNALKLASLPAVALEKASLSRASAILAVSGQSRSDLLGMYGLAPERVDVIGNGVDCERFSGQRETANPSAWKRVLVVSRLEPRKNVKEAIEAVAELPR
ncbi:MAG: glycosyltransferase family 4 protein, partial [Thaumarchaeota archaeon]|nr:glycosyltransferase family 4 protein [Nitrososphaerota archaeon]